MLAVVGQDGSSRDAYAIPIHQIVEAWPELLADGAVPACPYRGLQVFRGEDAEAGLFVGREAEVAQLRLMAGRESLTVVVPAVPAGLRDPRSPWRSARAASGPCGQQRPRHGGTRWETP